MTDFPSRARPRRTRRILLWTGALLFGALLLGAIGARVWFSHYLRSDRFLTMISKATSQALKAEGEYMPFEFNGSAIYSDGYEARGTSRAFFSGLRADRINADFDARGIFRHVWRIDELEIDRLQLRADSREERARDLEETGVARLPSFSWLPNRVELRRLLVHEAGIEWGDASGKTGSVKRSVLTVVPDPANTIDGEPGWNIDVTGGAVTESGLPPLEIDHATLRYRNPSLFIADSRLKGETQGTVAVTGELNFDENFDLRIKLDGLAVGGFIPPDWRQRLKGGLSGEIEARGPVAAGAPSVIEGTVSLANGDLEALPVLDQIAVFTNTPRFRTVTLRRASAAFVRTADHLSVTKIDIESEGLLRLEGSFIVQRGNIDGNFQVGVAPSSLQWLPGSRERVFTIARDGYIWTAMHLSGPVDHPTEDLSPRLIAAAQGAVIEGVENAITDPAKKALEPAKSLLDLVTPLIP